MIKIQTQQSKTPDKVTLTGSILTINGTKFDFDNLTDDNTLPVWKDSDDNIHVTLLIPENRAYLFRQWGMMRYFDIDDNNIIDLAEFKIALDYINETDNVKLKTDLDAIKAEYLKDHTVMEWRLKGKPA